MQFKTIKNTQHTIKFLQKISKASRKTHSANKTGSIQGRKPQKYIFGLIIIMK